MSYPIFGQRGFEGGIPISISYIDKPGLGQIAFLNFLLTVLTLTIYRFWAKTNVRRHIWSCVHINGEPLEYTGRGSELFLGFLIVFGVFFLPVIVIVTILNLTPGMELYVALVQFALALFFLVFWGMALYRARRYQLSRTLWRGIRGALVGSSWTYSLLYFGATLLRSMTLGWSTPAMNLNLQERMTGDMRFGSMPFRFKGRAGPLYGPYAICWVTTLFAMIAVGVLAFMLLSGPISELFGDFGQGPEGTPPDPGLMALVALVVFFVGFVFYGIIYAITWAFYVAREIAIFASYTTFDQARFQIDATGGSLIWLILGNLFLIIFTLGIATPFAQQRLVRYFCERITVHGTVNVHAILQSREVVGRTGEGLADAFDVSWI